VEPVGAHWDSVGFGGDAEVKRLPGRVWNVEPERRHGYPVSYKPTAPLHMNPNLPGPTAMAFLMFAVILTVWLGILGPVNISSVEHWQTLIAAAVAGLGIYFAVRNVSRQIRINILLREEDRLDKHLPGLRNAVNFLEPFLIFRSVTAFHGTTGEFARLGFGGAGSTMEKDVEKALPVTDDATRAKVLDHLFEAYRRALTAEGTRALKEELERTNVDVFQWDPNEVKKLRGEITGAQMRFVRERAEFSDQMEKVATLVDDIKSNITRYERRRVQIRREVERYFGD
jgi:hypothetical protein